MPADILGFLSIVVVALVTLLFAHRWPYLSNLLFIAFILRVLVSIFNVYLGSLPDSTADAVNFERLAWEWSERGLLHAFNEFTGPHSFFISWPLSLLYALTDRSLLMAQSVSMLFGMATVVGGALLSKELWGERVAVKAGWVLAVFPALILYSALVMREAYIWFFLVIALYGVALWIKKGNLRYIVIALLGFLGATFFHGAMIVGAIFFIIYVVFRSLRKMIISLTYLRLHTSSVFLISVLVFSLIIYVASGISLPKLGTVQQALSTERIMAIVDSRTGSSDGETGASYPTWTVPNSAVEIPVKAPIRMVYFTFSPFPWGVHLPGHLVGLFDSAIYILLCFLIWRNRHAIWAKPELRIILFIILAYLLVFSFGVGNFGTGIRHRAKFAVGLVILAAPLLPMLKFRSGNAKK